VRLEYYTADWCSACKGLRPHVVEACNDAKIALDFIDAGNDGNADYCIRHNVSTLPTIIIYSNEGIELDRIVGSFGKHELAKRILDAGKGD
jgi:thiol:disulfide interchange protein